MLSQVLQVQHNMSAPSNLEDDHTVKALSWVLKEKDSGRRSYDCVQTAVGYSDSHLIRHQHHHLKNRMARLVISKLRIFFIFFKREVLK